MASLLARLQPVPIGQPHNNIIVNILPLARPLLGAIYPTLPASSWSLRSGHLRLESERLVSSPLPINRTYHDLAAPGPHRRSHSRRRGSKPNASFAFRF